MSSQDSKWDRSSWGSGKPKENAFKYSTPRQTKVDGCNSNDDNNWRKKSSTNISNRRFERTNLLKDEKIWSRGGEVALNAAVNLLNEMSQENYGGTISEKLLEPQVRLEDLLNNYDKLDITVTMTIIKIVLKESEENKFDKNFRKFFSLILGTTFSKRIDALINVDLAKDPREDVLTAVISFLKLSFEIMPGLAYDLFYTRVENLQVAISSQRISSITSPETTSEMNELREIVTSCGLTQSDAGPDVVEPPDNYRLMSIFPTRADLLVNDTRQVFLRENKDHGAYSSVNHYLDVQFRLMHEDFIRPLREGIIEYRKNKVNKSFNIRVYKKVSFIKRIPDRRMGIVYQLHFDRSRLTNVDWSETKRFLNGSLLCMSYDNFETFTLATVTRVNEQEVQNGELSVIVVDGVILDYQEYTIIESTTFFESYRYVLAKLQKMTEEDISMRNYIVYGSKERSLPIYLQKNSDIKYTFVKNAVINNGWSFESDDEADNTFMKVSVRPCSNDEWPAAADLKMNESQYEAFKKALTTEMTIIQGPPGTGKTYLGLSICKCLLENVQSPISDFGPILIVCYTNHALDQFLEGISAFTNKIVRIGGGCKSEKIRTFALKQLKQTKIQFMDKEDLYDEIEALEEEFRFRDIAFQSFITLKNLETIISKEHYEHLRQLKLEKWLYGESLEQDNLGKNSFLRPVLDSIVRDVLYGEVKRVCQGVMDNINDDDAIKCLSWSDVSVREFDPESLEGFTPVKVRSAKSIFSSFVKKQEKMSVNEAVGVTSLDRLTVVNRWRLYRYWRNLFVMNLKKSLREKEEQYNRLSKKLNKAILTYEAELIKKQDIIGMTTTIAAKYGRVLKEIRCKIIIVEEAAEVIESHLIASLNVGCEHLILIGDHKQLKPNPAVYELAKNYGMDISLFERLVNNGVEYTTLTTQHRMRPEISKIMSFIYKDLCDHGSVLNYPDVPAVSTNVFFFNHFEPEDFLEDVLSYNNKFEAAFVIKFCNHLLGNGVDPKRITILTLYSGQKFFFGSIMDKELHADVRVAVVDNFQGEENDIILLSLVRSNEYEQIGFLNIENRICVSLSRAKHGLYVFGNFDILVRRSKLWKNICNFLEEKHLIGKAINMFCQNHPDKRLIVTVPTDFDKYPNSGCEQLCNTVLACSHICPKYCHFLDKDHVNHRCTFDCARKCVNGHPCRLRCHEGCTQCRVNLKKKIQACGHDQMMPCFKQPMARDCKNPCERVLLCGHLCTRLCGEACNPCVTKVQRISKRCGHLGYCLCSEVDIVCKETCDCVMDCSHRCRGRCTICFEQHYHEACEGECGSLLVCGHSCNKKCASFCYPCRQPCLEGCPHGVCPLLCGSVCVKCTEPCQWECAHGRCTASCQEMCNRDVCSEPCRLACTCGSCGGQFLCYGLCGETCRRMCARCDSDIVEGKVYLTLMTCGHTFEVSILDEYMFSGNGSGKIVRKTCPTCGAVINRRSCFRYMNVVREISRNIECVLQGVMVKDIEEVEYSYYYRIMHSLRPLIFEMLAEFEVKNYFLGLAEDLSSGEWADVPDCLFEEYFSRDDIWRNVLLYKHLLSAIIIYQVCLSARILQMGSRSSIASLLRWLNPNNRSFNYREVSHYRAEIRRLKSEGTTVIPQMTDVMAPLFRDANHNFSSKFKRYTEECLLKMLSLLIKVDFKGKAWFKCVQGHIFMEGSECGSCTRDPLW